MAKGFSDREDRFSVSAESVIRYGRVAIQRLHLIHMFHNKPLSATPLDPTPNRSRTGCIGGSRQLRVTIQLAVLHQAKSRHV